MNNTKVIEREIEFWANKNQFYNNYFRKGTIRGLIHLCEIITQRHPLDDKLISDFIAGLALFPICMNTKNEEQGKEFDMLTNPVIEIISKHVTSEEYRKLIIDKGISGEAIFKCNGVESPISQKELLLHIERTNATPLVPKDISAIERDWIEYKRMQYTVRDNQPPQQKETNPETLPETKTIKQKVEKVFAFMQGEDPRKHKQILNKTDFQNLINWVILYFENDFVIPDISKPIQKVNTNKGNVIYTFMSFFKELHPSKTRPDSLFNLIKSCFYEYRNDKLENLKKTKEPQYYDQLISKNK